MQQSAGYMFFFNITEINDKGYNSIETPRKNMLKE